MSASLFVEHTTHAEARARGGQDGSIILAVFG
jgi:hypothetical protein